jgi:hypothetical protein
VEIIDNDFEPLVAPVSTMCHIKLLFCFERPIIAATTFYLKLKHG